MRQFNLGLNLTTDAAKAIAKAMTECTLFETSLERTDRVLAALAKADLVIVPKVRGNADAVREAVRTGNWSAVSERDLLAWRDAPLPGEAVPVVEGPVTLEVGNILTLPPGTEIRSADTAAPERDDLGLRPWSADDLAARYGCRVEVAGMDDAHMPLTDEGIAGDPQYVVVTERATGRVVGMVEAWRDEDGDVLVPHAWLSTVLSAWDAARDPQQAA
ncbi:hypothetical protein ABZT49_05910 [Methylobacterium sp. EM32]|uniref:hypothetical protein n=1 Tax=unclassified Methylobacterium TaxID=2615210 RepID=UPI0008EC66CB|nr:hypothetical protein [Methylobacterium sp. 174MFSha1.1]SFU92612.1 hypothetical protein SAMN02799631_03172 [Methylobacterium sp. 174MFSha1.1]